LLEDRAESENFDSLGRSSSCLSVYGSFRLPKEQADDSFSVPMAEVDEEVEEEPASQAAKDELLLRPVSSWVSSLTKFTKDKREVKRSDYSVYLCR